MSLVHTYLGLGLISIFALIAVWGGVSAIRNKHPGRGFWWLLTAGQVGLGLQVIAGIALFASGARRPWLHYAYGGFPILVLAFVHRFSKKRLPGLEWAAFAVAGLVIAGLLTRGYMTGTPG